MMFGVRMSPIAARAGRSLSPLILLTLFSVGGGVLTDMYVRDPAQSHVIKAQADYDAARHSHVRQEAARRTLEELAGLWKEVPERKEFSLMVVAISELAQQDHVAIPGVTYAFQKLEDGLALKAAMTFQAAADYTDIRRFLHRLEASGPYLFIESLDATRLNRGHARDRVVFNVRVVTFLRPDQAGISGKV